MAHIFVHAVGATAGGGATYIRHFLDQIRYRSQEHQWTVLLRTLPRVPPRPSRSAIFRPTSRSSRINNSARDSAESIWIRLTIRNLV